LRFDENGPLAQLVMLATITAAIVIPKPNVRDKRRALNFMVPTGLLYGLTAFVPWGKTLTAVTRQ
jgi:hypothetical protein